MALRKFSSRIKNKIEYANLISSNRFAIDLHFKEFYALKEVIYFIRKNTRD